MTIEVISLSKYYRMGNKTLKAVHDLSLTIPTGEVFAFLGPNGAGKTTTIKMICGLITPTAGQIKINGYDIARHPGKGLGQIGAVLEGTRNIYWRLSAWDNLLYFGRLRGCSDKQIKPMAEQLLRELDLWDRRNDPTRHFSRGMQQKIAIAAALVSDPAIVILDEPTLGLDVESAKAVEGWLLKLAIERGKTVLLTTHQLDMAQRVSDRVGIIKKGQLVVNQPITELLAVSSEHTYTVKVKGQINQLDYPWLLGVTVSPLNEADTQITGIPDQEHLYELLGKLRVADMQLLSASYDAPDLEEVFLRLVKKGKGTGVLV